MYVTYERSRGALCASLHGEIDHHSAQSVREDIDKTILQERPDEFKLELSDISFMDSSGLGLVMGRYRTVTGIGGTMSVVNPSANVLKILNMAGMDKLIKIEANERKSKR